jgi:asparagine synthase (glutamine-hydrolysing)
MCGIAGVFRRTGLAPEDRGRVSGMSRALAHRGPDGAGAFSDDHLALAVRRLAIVDPLAGDQPIADETGNLVIVANCEIYNHGELRHTLEARGRRFQSASDAEVLLKVIAEFGPAGVERLRGMFAFAIWDRRRRTLLLGRDRMGEKPLVFFHDADTFVFASEIKGLVASGLVPIELDPIAIHYFFHHQFVPEPRTPLAGVEKLPPATLLEIDVDRWDARPAPYWNLLAAQAIEDNPAQSVRASLEDAVDACTRRTGESLAIALSGGLDSSAIAALARRAPVISFSVGYPGRPDYDERAQASMLSATLGIPHREIELTGPQIAAEFPELILRLDDLVADVSAFGFDAVARAAKTEGVRILLLGQGGDELFWYPDVQPAVRETEDMRALHAGDRIFLDYLSMRLPPARLRGLARWAIDAGGLVPATRRFARDRVLDPTWLVLHELTPDYREARQRARGIYGPAMQDALAASDPARAIAATPGHDRPDLLITEQMCRGYLLGDGLALADRLGMGHGVESRLPFCDHRLVETAIALRRQHKDHHLAPKKWLRDALAADLPDAVLQRRKRGFQPPVTAWYAALFREYGQAIVDGEAVGAGIVQPAAATALSRAPGTDRSVTPMAYKTLVFEHWLRGMKAILRTAPFDANGRSPVPQGTLPPRHPGTVASFSA